MTKTYAIADLHGRYDLLIAAIERIEAGNHSGGTIVFLGDYVDRGPQSAQIIEHLMAGPSDPNRWKWICLQGNHEAIMLTCYANRKIVHSFWLPNGGGNTLISYGQKYGENANLDVIPQTHIDWLSALPLMHVDQHRVFVHAGVDPDLPLDDQDSERLQWKLYQDFDERGHGDKHVVHGHHQFEDGPLLYSGRTDLDTFAWYTGRLVVGVFDDNKAGGPVSTIEIKLPSHQQIKAAK